jgi:hypothetical protein
MIAPHESLESTDPETGWHHSITPERHHWRWRADHAAEQGALS